MISLNLTALSRPNVQNVFSKPCWTYRNFGLKLKVVGPANPIDHFGKFDYLVNHDFFEVVSPFERVRLTLETLR